MVTLGPLTAPERPGVVPALRAMCPAKQVKANLSHLYFSLCPSSHHFLLRHHFFSDLHQNTPALNFAAWKTGETSPCFKPSHRLVFFTPVLNQCCLPGVPPFSLSPPYTTLIKHFQTGSPLTCISPLSSTLLHGAKHGQKGWAGWGQSKPSFEPLTANSHLMGGSLFPACLLIQVASLVDF